MCENFAELTKRAKPFALIKSGELFSTNFFVALIINGLDKATATQPVAENLIISVVLWIRASSKNENLTGNAKITKMNQPCDDLDIT